MNDFLANIWNGIRNFFGFSKPISKSGNLTQDDLFNAEKKERELELNRILEKINRKGMSSLTSKERKFLESQNY